MKFNYFFLIFLSIQLSSLLVNAQFYENARCETIDPTALCAPYLGYTSIYVNDTWSQPVLNALAENSFASFDKIPYLQCKSDATLLYCLQMYPQCTNIQNVSIPIPARPCYSVCSNVNNSCPEFILKIAYPNGFSCDFPDPSLFLPMFPVEYTYYNLTMFGGSDNQSIQCEIGQQKQAELICPSPLLKLDEDVITSANYYPVYENCVLPCPVQVYTDKQMRDKFLTEIICFCFSTFMSFFLILTFGILPNKTNHRWLIIVYICITNLSLCASYAIQESNMYWKTHRTDWRCTDDPGRYKDHRDSTCQLMGFFFNVGGLGTIMFLSLYSFDFFLTMQMKTNKYFVHTSIGMWLFILFMSLLPMKQFTSSVVSSGCWIGSGADMFYQYFCFYAPAYLSTLLMVIFISFSTYKLFRMTILFKSLNDKRILILNIRSIVFLFLILFCVVFTSFYPLYTTYNDKPYIDAIATWVTCLFTLGESQCGHIQFSGWSLRYLNFTTMAIIGVLLFLFTIDPSVLQIYRESTKLKRFFALFGIEWGTPLPSGNNSNTNTTSDNSSGSNQNNQNNRKSMRKSRGLSLSAKKSISSSESSNSIEMGALNQSTNSSNGNLDSSTTHLTVTNQNNNEV